MRDVRDSDGVEVAAGDKVRFAYGCPPVCVLADVIERDGRLIALTPGHTPSECPVDLLRRHVGDFWIAKGGGHE